MNCCQAEHGFCPHQKFELSNFFGLSWSEKVLGPITAPVIGLISVSLIPLGTLSKDPTAVDMAPDDTWAT